MYVFLIIIIISYNGYFCLDTGNIDAICNTDAPPLGFCWFGLSPQLPSIFAGKGY